MKAATKVAIATLSSVLLLGSSASLAAEAQSVKKAQASAKEKQPKQPSLYRQRKKKFIEKEIQRVKELTEESGDMYVLYHKYPKLNSGFDISYWGGYMNSLHTRTTWKSLNSEGVHLEAACQPAKGIQVLISGH